MLDQLLIFTRGGLVLWTFQELGKVLKGSPVDALIRTCLLEERAGDSSFQYDAAGAAYTLKWRCHNELGLVFVAVYQRMLHLLYVDELLEKVMREFTNAFEPKQTVYHEFDDTFRQLLEESEANARLSRAGQQRPIENSKKGSESKGQNGQIQRNGGKSAGKNSQAKKEGADEDGEVDGSKPKVLGYSNGTGNGHANGNKANGSAHSMVNGSSASASSSDEDSTAKQNSRETAFDVNKLVKLRSKAKKGLAPLEGPKATSKDDAGSKKTKKNRVWGDAPPPSKLDFTDPVNEEQGEVRVHTAVEKGLSLMDKDDDDENFEVEEDMEEEAEESGKKAAPKKGWLSSLVQSVAGKAALEKADLEPALKTFKERLMTKNVATDIAGKLCESVAASLVGKKQGSFTDFLNCPGFRGSICKEAAFGGSREMLSVGNVGRMGVLWILCLIYSYLCLLRLRLWRRPPPSQSHHEDHHCPASHLKPACIVTGATSGIGRATASALALRGFHVILAGRALERLQAAQAEIEAQQPDVSCQALELDLCSVPSILSFSKTIRELFEGESPPGTLQLLVNNAGILATSRRWTEDGVDVMTASNYLGPYMLTHELLPLLQKSAPKARVVNVVSFTHRAVRSAHIDVGRCQLAKGALPKSGSGGGEDSYPLARIYEASKMCLTLFTYELHRKVFADVEPGTGVSVVCADPGAVHTNILREVPRWLAHLSSLVLGLLRLLQSPADGAAAVMTAATVPWDVSGSYFFGNQGLSCRSSHLSYNGQLARQLWEASESLRQEAISLHTK